MRLLAALFVFALLACSSDPTDTDADGRSDTANEVGVAGVDAESDADAVEDAIALEDVQAPDAAVDASDDDTLPDGDGDDAADSATRDVADGGSDAGDPDAAPRTSTNVLLIIADDLGVSESICYADDVGPAPHLRELCERGVVFTQAWSQPICSPTRAAILTGRHGFRTGVGDVAGGGSAGIDPAELTLPRALHAAFGDEISSANIGKWHLSESLRNPGDSGPIEMGWQHFVGLLGGGVESYSAWPKNTVDLSEDAPRYVSEDTETYITTDLIDEAIAWTGARETPWLLWLALTAPHTPIHLPPESLHTQDLDGSDIDDRQRDYLMAMVEAMDTELGRLFDALGEETLAETTIIFVGDNGTVSAAAGGPGARAKGSLYEGGIHVPLIIAGPQVAEGGRTVDALANVVDLYPTLLELLGAPSVAEIDGVSLVPQLRSADAQPTRTWNYADHFGPNANAERTGSTIRNARYKLLRLDDGGDALFDLQSDPNERRDLLDAPLDDEADAAYAELLEAWTALRSE